MRRDRQLYNLERKLIGKKVIYYISDLPRRGEKELPKYGPFVGRCVGIENNEQDCERRGEDIFTWTGEAIIIPDNAPPAIQNQLH